MPIEGLSRQVAPERSPLSRQVAWPPMPTQGRPLRAGATVQGRPFKGPAASRRGHATPAPGAGRVAAGSGATSSRPWRPTRRSDPLPITPGPARDECCCRVPAPPYQSPAQERPAHPWRRAAHAPLRAHGPDLHGPHVSGRVFRAGCFGPGAYHEGEALVHFPHPVSGT
jgi:hypothetical protein